MILFYFIWIQSEFYLQIQSELFFVSNYIIEQLKLVDLINYNCNSKYIYDFCKMHRDVFQTVQSHLVGVDVFYNRTAYSQNYEYSICKCLNTFATVSKKNCKLIFATDSSNIKPHVSRGK